MYEDGVPQKEVVVVEEEEERLLQLHQNIFIRESADVVIYIYR